jgi:uncharacterized integral membrane protein
MKVFGWILLLALVLLAVFTMANWSLFIAPATLNLLVFSVQGPLGLVLLGVTFVVIALFAIYALSLRANALVDERRRTRELEAQRTLADNAEASRFTALKTELDQQCATLRTSIDQARAQVLARTDALEASMTQSLNETANALFANIAQVDDKLDRVALRGGTGA